MRNLLILASMGLLMTFATSSPPVAALEAPGVLFAFVTFGGETSTGVQEGLSAIRCGGTSPVTNECHVQGAQMSGSNILYGVSWAPLYTGRITTSSIDDDQETFAHWCDIQSGTLQGCWNTGVDHPDPGDVFNMDCSSTANGSGNGPVGKWACEIQYDG